MIIVPEFLLRRFNKVIQKAYNLDGETYEVFLDDLLTAAENRLKVFKK